MTDGKRFCEGCQERHPTERGAVNLLCEECGAAIERKPSAGNPQEGA